MVPYQRPIAWYECRQADVPHLEEEITTQLYTHNGSAERGRKTCPPHGPHLVHVLKEGSYVVQCLACRVVGPERKNSLEAKRAFDEATDAGDDRARGCRPL